MLLKRNGGHYQKTLDFMQNKQNEFQINTFTKQSGNVKYFYADGINKFNQDNLELNEINKLNDEIDELNLNINHEKESKCKQYSISNNDFVKKVKQ